MIEAVELGKIIEIELAGGRLIEMPSRAPLYWLPAQRCLFWSSTRPKNQKQSDRASRRQLQTFNRWHQQPPKGARIETYKEPAPGDWYEVGELRRIDYYSKKWDDRAEYTHRSRGGSHVWRAGSIWVVHGKIRATTRGLIR